MHVIVSLYAQKLLDLLNPSSSSSLFDEHTSNKYCHGTVFKAIQLQFYRMLHVRTIINIMYTV